MAIRQEIINLDTFYKNVTGNKILLNSLSLYDSNHTNMLHKFMVNEFESDSFNILPKCSCGKYIGEFHKGHVCEVCETEVGETSYDPVIWAKAFDKDLKFINPIFYYRLNSMLGSDIQYLTGITNTTRTKDNVSATIARNVLMGERTYKNFVYNIRNILVFISTLGQYRQPSRAYKLACLLHEWDTRKDDILTMYIPFINNILFNVTKTNKGNYTDTGFATIYDIASSWMRVSNNMNTTDRIRDLVTAKTVNSLGLMPEFYIKYYLSKKAGIFRKHCYGARSPFTLRAVIVSRPGRHMWNEIIVPWVTMVSVFRPHVLNILCNRYGFSYKEASDRIFAACKKYDPLIDEVATTLIKETPNGRGIPAMIQRNPSLYQGSALKVYIPGYGKDPSSNVIEFSQGLCKWPNADYDGDEMNVTIALDNFMANKFEVLNTLYNVLDGSRPGEISKHLTLLAPMNNVLMEYLKSDIEHPDRDTLAKELIG